MYLGRFCFLLVAALPAVANAEPEWKSHTGQWCLRDGTFQMCLPKEFEPQNLAAYGADFALPDDEVNPNIFISFRYLSAESEIEALDLGDIYIEKHAQKVGNLSLIEYEIDQSKAKIPGVETFVINLSGSFALVLTSSEGRKLDELANALTRQWSE